MNQFIESLPPIDLAQGIGFLSFALGILCFYQKDDKRLKITMVILNINHAVHFAMLGAITACVSAILAALRTSISIKSSSKFIAYIFMLLTLILGVYISNSPLDMLPIIGSCIGTYSLFCLNGIKMRIGFVFGALCWLANNILVGSIGTTLLEATLLIVNLSTIYRLHRQSLL